MKSSIKALVVIVISFAIYYFLDDVYFKSTRQWFFDNTNQIGLSQMITYTLSLIPLLIGTFLITGKSGILESLGLRRSPVKAFLFALICTAPMFIGFSLIFSFNTELTFDRILIAVVAAGFFEEVIFRAFLFGLIFRYTKLGFIPSVLLGSIYFGSLHLSQGTEFAELTGIFLITFMGGILFSWTYVEWRFNLWIPIFLHMLMNLAWEVFSVSDNALGGIYSNVFRGITIALAIILTIRYRKKEGPKMGINKQNLLIQKNKDID